MSVLSGLLDVDLNSVANLDWPLVMLSTAVAIFFLLRGQSLWVDLR